MIIDTWLSAHLSETPNNNEPSGYKWSHEKMEDFVNDIDVMVNAILSELDNANNHNVNEIVHEINNVWEKSAKKHLKATGFAITNCLRQV